jgi:hypothetical protein
MLVTPTSVQVSDSPEKMKERKEKNGYRNGTTYCNLETQVKYDPKVQGLMRTPSAMDARNWEGTEYTGGGTLAQEVVQNEKYKSLLPTPTARDEKNPSPQDGKRITRKVEQGYTIELNDLAGMQMLPTPRVSLYKVEGTDLNNPNIANRSKGNLEEEVAKMVVGILPTPTCNDATNATIPISQGKRNDSIVKRIVTGEIPSDYTPKKDGNTFRLSPLFTEEMMGFPLMWTALPFLQCQARQHTEKETQRSIHSVSGAPNPSKPTGTR